MSWFSNTCLETCWPWQSQVLTINNDSLRIHWETDGIQHLPKHSLQYLQRNEEECIQYTVYPVYPVYPDRSMPPSPLLLIALLDTPFGFLCIFIILPFEFLNFSSGKKKPRNVSYFSSSTFPFRLPPLLFFAIICFLFTRKKPERHMSVTTAPSSVLQRS